MAPIIHQALHGYSDGHRLISTSLPLSSSDARIMVVMSDLSGPGVRAEPSGYLTGYPLEGSGKYVLARTWAAPEMPRPGCVWTHSLIIDNADLATLTSADNLLSVFRRPSGSSPKSEYTEPARIRNEPHQAAPIHSDRAREIVNGLYAAPDRTIVAEAGHAEVDERMITSIWMQQWPRLRRVFAFCTLAGIDRSGKGVSLDLQLIRSPDRQIRAKFPNAVIPSEVVPDLALEPLMADLEGRDDTQIREFLRRAGGDVDGGRRAMLPLCLLYSSLFMKSHPDLVAAIDALGKLDSFGSRQARALRTMIARNAIENVDNLDDAVFDFVMDTLEQSSPSSDQLILAERVAKALWHRSPVRFFDAIDADGVVGRASVNALASIAAPDLVVGLLGSPVFAERVVGARPEVLQRADFWNIPSVDERLAAGVDALDASRVASALLAAGRRGSASLIVSRAESSELAAVLDANARAPALDAWLEALIRDPGKAAAVLASSRILHRSVVAGLARVSTPDAVPNHFGEDPWLIAIRTASQPAGLLDEDYLAAFLLARAIGHSSRSQAELIRFGYTTLHRALQQRRLPGDVELMITSRLDWGGWFSWDNCLRLRETVVGRFVDRHLDPEIFGRLTDDADLAILLIDEAAHTGRGRRYLSDVRKLIMGSEDHRIRARADYISEKVD